MAVISTFLPRYSLIQAQLPLRRRNRRRQITQPSHVVAKIPQPNPRCGSRHPYTLHVAVMHLIAHRPKHMLDSRSHF